VKGLGIGVLYNARNLQRNTPIDETPKEETGMSGPDDRQVEGTSYGTMYNQSWTEHLANGNEDFGDLELARQFLDATGLLDPSHRIIEIGAGIGKLSQHLREQGFTNLTCTDLSSASVAYGASKFEGLDIRVMDACDLRFPSECADRIISFDLVEHLPDVNLHLREVFRVLKPGGYYLFQTPNVLTNSIHETIQARGLRWRVWHPSLQTAGGLKRRLNCAGFGDVQFLKLPPTSDYKLAQLPAVLRSLFRAIPFTRFPLWMQIGFWCVARK